MDRSVDSIGSCSLDVDADSTDFSDTSGELNFLTPSSAKDITKEFTAGIKERCKLPLINCQAVTTVLDPVTGNINTVLTTTSPLATDSIITKKPSYLNLACCVNGYSNLTTYDSKLRQDINKSREVSPSRPIIATLHYNRSEGNSFNLTAPNLSYISMNNNCNSNNRNILKMNHKDGGKDVTDNVLVFNGNGGGIKNKVILSTVGAGSKNEKLTQKSFIQQRVEKLYGNMEGVVINKQIYNNNERKYLTNIANENNNKNNYIQNNQNDVVDEINKDYLENSNESLPVLRHLRPEFRAQLQIFSPKKILKSPPNSNHNLLIKNENNNNNNKDNLMTNGNTNHHHYSNGSPPTNNLNSIMTQNQKPSHQDNKEAIDSNVSDITLKESKLVNTSSSTSIITVTEITLATTPPVNNCDTSSKSADKSLANMKLTDEQNDLNGDENNKENHDNVKVVVKDGTYFLSILKNEQNRLISMAVKIEQELEQLENDGVEISEEISGYLRSGSGKARLLATQKMKQFEGLCYNNLNQLPDEKFQTTKEDLQGFWDMVMLQVKHIDELFEELDSFRSNGWKKPLPKSPTPQVKSRSTKLVKRPYKSPPTTTNGTTNALASASAASQRRDAQRKQLMEMKRKQKLANGQQDVEFFVPPVADMVDTS